MLLPANCVFQKDIQQDIQKDIQKDTMNILLTYCTIFSALVIISSSYADFVYVTNSPDEEPGYLNKSSKNT